MIFIYEAEMEEVIAVLTSISKRILIVSDNSQITVARKALFIYNTNYTLPFSLLF